MFLFSRQVVELANALSQSPFLAILALGRKINAFASGSPCPPKWPVSSYSGSSALLGSSQQTSLLSSLVLLLTKRSTVNRRDLNDATVVFYLNATFT